MESPVTLVEGILLSQVLLLFMLYSAVSQIHSQLALAVHSKTVQQQGRIAHYKNGYGRTTCSSPELDMPVASAHSGNAELYKDRQESVSLKGNAQHRQQQNVEDRDHQRSSATEKPTVDSLLPEVRPHKIVDQHHARASCGRTCRAFASKLNFIRVASYLSHHELHWHCKLYGE
eukprot:6187621-Pleurochrysis_carterae.AAC.4